MDLALFDFDGTITVKPTFTDFVHFSVRPRRKVVGGILLSPLIVGYHAGLVSQPDIRRAISRVSYQGVAHERIRQLGELFARDVLPGVIRPLALERIDWHRARGDRIVVVSAGLDVYLEPWCRTLGVELISTQLETEGGVLTGRYAGGDCCGAEKSRRIRARYDLDSYTAVYAYGDTEEDREMLALADRRFFCWEEVDETPAATSPAPSSSSPLR